MRRAGLMVLAASSLMILACGGSQTDVFAPPEGKEGPLALALETGDGAVLTWRDQPDEFAYRIAGIVKYGPPCELVDEGVRGTERHGLDAVLPPDTTRYELPPPDDERLTLVLEVTAKVTALQEGGADKPTADGIGFTADAFCH